MHGRDLTGHLLAFSRRRLLNPQPVDVNALVSGIVKLLGRTLGPSIQLTTDTAGDAGIAFVDPGGLEAAVLNVALNARDAMPDGGPLTIRTARADVIDATSIDEDLKPGTYVRLALQDTGCGMPADVVARVFEPFYTTKAGGRGTGLGLSMVYGFVKQSGGAVTIQSQPGHGTTVTMLLPMAATATKAGGAGGDALTSSAPHMILLVEDEDDVRAIVRRQLETLGHTVLVADAATEALLLLQGPAIPDVLVTDVVLGGGMNGIDLAAAARRVRANLPVIFISGYTAIAEAQQRMREMGARLLSKPFTTPQLEQAIQEVCTAVAPRS
jgi:CheY-like chemotaxis protein